MAIELEKDYIVLPSTSGTESLGNPSMHLSSYYGQTVGRNLNALVNGRGPVIASGSHTVETGSTPTYTSAYSTVTGTELRVRGFAWLPGIYDRVGYAIVGRAASTTGYVKIYASKHRWLDDENGETYRSYAAQVVFSGTTEDRKRGTTGFIGLTPQRMCYIYLVFIDCKIGFYSLWGVV